jgi:four helix bundle protein
LARIERFEDVIAWQKARSLTCEVYRVSNQGAFARDFALRDQVRRACISVMSNIAEGFERYSGAEFKHFLAVARGSAAEVRSQLYLACDLGYVDQETFDRFRRDCSEISRLLGALRTSIERKFAATRS